MTTTSEATAMTRPPDAPSRGRAEPLGAGWTAATIAIGVMAALIALGGMTLSFRAVRTEMIPAFGDRWAFLVPIVVDLTVFVFSGVDLVLTRLAMGHPLARATVYAATAGTVWLNYGAGGDPFGRAAHVLMPSIWVVFVELMRHVVRRRTNLATGTHREPIPTTRWLLSPWPTLKLWRRMVLWRVNSYPRALEQEKMRLARVAALRDTHGRAWRWKVSAAERLSIDLGEPDPDRTARPDGAPASRRPARRDTAARPAPVAPGAPGADHDATGRTRPQRPATAGPSRDTPAAPPARLPDPAERQERDQKILALIARHGRPDKARGIKGVTGPMVAETLGVHRSNGARALDSVLERLDRGELDLLAAGEAAQQEPAQRSEASR